MTTKSSGLEQFLCPGIGVWLPSDQRIREEAADLWFTVREIRPDAGAPNLVLALHDGVFRNRYPLISNPNSVVITYKVIVGDFCIISCAAPGAALAMEGPEPIVLVGVIVIMGICARAKKKAREGRYRFKHLLSAALI